MAENKQPQNNTFRLKTLVVLLLDLSMAKLTSLVCGTHETGTIKEVSPRPAALKLSGATTAFPAGTAHSLILHSFNFQPEVDLELLFTGEPS